MHMANRNTAAFFLRLFAAAVLFVGAVADDSMPPAMFVFGDSTVDVGNNNFLPADAPKANHLFYGVDYPGGVPTGRFSNGYNVVDFLAMMMGFRASPPPVLSIKNNSQVLRGVNFASGGSGILNTTGQNVSLSMNTQVGYFEEVVMYLNESMGPEGAARFLSRSIFVFSTASNDLFAMYQTLGPQNSTVKDQFVSTLASNFKAQLQRIYDLGARKFAVIGTAHIGCVPSVRLLVTNGSCFDDLNDLSRRFNNASAGLLNDLGLTLRGMNHTLANTFQLFSDVLSSPAQYGFTEARSACCGGGRLNAEENCTVNATLCSDRSEYAFWDGVHPTQSTYRLMATHAYGGSPAYAAPVNLRELLKSTPIVP